MRMITHSYDTYEHAARAVRALESAGVPHDDISLVSGDKDRNVGTSVDGDAVETTKNASGTGATLGTALGGGAGLLAGLGALAIPGVGPVVAAGWLIATLTGAGVGAAAGGLLGSLTGAGVSEADAHDYAEHVGRGGTLLTVRASDAMAAQVEHILEHGDVPATTGMAAPIAAAPVAAARVATAPVATAPVATAPVATASTARATTPAVGAADDRIELVKEELVVGKREVEQGGTRITTRVVETPVEEQVQLRQERVVVDRRPINRPLTGVAADAFRSRTISASASSEEAVVGKDVRVVEEIGLRKEASERVETVRDTVRETKLDVEQVPGSATTTRTGTVAGQSATVQPGTVQSGTAQPGTVRDNAATRTVDGALGTNVSGTNPTR